MSKKNTGNFILEKPTWGETSADSPRHGLHVNSLLGLSIKLKVEFESTLEKRKFWISASFSIKFQLLVKQETLGINIW